MQNLLTGVFHRNSLKINMKIPEPQLVVFLCADNPKTMESVCNVIPSQSTTDYHLIVTPKVSTLSRKMLVDKKGIKDNGKPGKLQSVVSCLIDIYVLDPYLFTININDSFQKSLQDWFSHGIGQNDG